ncbi:hypothetical protein HCN44_002375 [Aphidius gifuensis]|uniref:Uncharacterized protein n=1 Tax=Aphidius gifuensis TaxID=684658 RepID=A0A834Y3Z8_APHGI|nr:uncharacterized protein LOC122860775 [Aphidius gifuensis]KAF7996729.1 hypothetical protein HCN44_002375 [Aphidius gifuensis]
MADNKVDNITENNIKTDHTLALRASITSIIKDIAGSVGKEEFVECLSLLSGKSKVLDKLYDALVGDIENSLNADFDEMLANGNLDSELGKLKDAIANSTKNPNEIAWRPPGNVEEHLRSPDIEKIFEETDRLKNILDKIENENSNLKKLLDEKRKLTNEIDKKILQAHKIGKLSIPKMEKIAHRLETYNCQNDK